MMKSNKFPYPKLLLGDESIEGLKGFKWDDNPSKGKKIEVLVELLVTRDISDVISLFNDTSKEIKLTGDDGTYLGGFIIEDANIVSLEARVNEAMAVTIKCWGDINDNSGV